MTFARISSFSKNRSGMAAAEFALILPILLLLFFGVVEGSDALSKTRRVTLAANTLADLASQETELLESSVDSLFVGVEEIINVGGASLDVRLVSVILEDSDGDGTPDAPVVHWSYDNSGGEPYSPGSAYSSLPNPALLSADTAIIIAEVNFPYTSPFTHQFISTINIDRIATRWPRRSLRVQLCSMPGNCTS